MTRGRIMSPGSQNGGMTAPIYVVDAFTRHAFAGNPAAVCLLDTPANETWMQNVAAEMKHAETAFLVPRGEGYQLRWFTPAVEVDLCGHATLASAHVLWNCGRLSLDQPAIFETKSGTLRARHTGELIELDFPSLPPSETPLDGIEAAIGAKPVWVGKSRFDYLAELESEAAVRNLKPDIAAINRLDARGLMVTARGSEHDFVSRFFAPQAGVDEDSVTGSAHCVLGPYWVAKIGKETLDGYQASQRGGLVRVTVRGDRCHLGGHAVTVLEGSLTC